MTQKTPVAPNNFGLVAAFCTVAVAGEEKSAALRRVAGEMMKEPEEFQKRYIEETLRHDLQAPDLQVISFEWAQLPDWP